MRMQSVFFLLIIVFIVLFNCSLPTGEEIDEYENIMIFSGNKELVMEMDTPIILESESESRSSGMEKAPVVDFNYNIRQICRIHPTTVDGHTVQANDIIISGNTAYVAYNTAGEVFAGAIQIMEIWGKKITLTKEIRFTDMDIICLSLHGNELVFGGMANPDVFDGNRSVIGTIDLRKPKASDVRNSFVYLGSYAATGIAFLDDRYYVSVGAAGGGIKILDKDMKPVEGSLETPDIPADDIRDIEAYGSGVIALAGTTGSPGTDGRILVVKGNTKDNEITIEDFNSPEAKATIEVNGNYAYLGLSAKGFQVCNLVEENILFTFNNPDGDSLHVTNSISYDDNLIFSANGEYGFRVLNYTPPATEASVVGFYSFDGLTDKEGQNYSANHIAYKSRYLFVASGAGGVSIYQLTDK
ncbi:MAG: hypothetical protein JXB88_01090 [Spirochaetales bacterium]|nr:hypothetical protein [Spirochaetales bacterium]